MILVIDNYDSFVHNLARYFGELGCARKVVRNDAAPIETLLFEKPSAIILSPGPCTPSTAGISVDIVRRAAEAKIPLLGVCLGHQCIAEAFGGQTLRAPTPRHGKTSPINHQGHRLFHDLPNPFPATRYHSLISQLAEPGPLKTIATSADDNQLMAFAHESLPIFGVQFHPESILTTHGHLLLRNFLDLAGVEHSGLPAQMDRAS